jgi:hypothetical protein
MSTMPNTMERMSREAERAVESTPKPISTRTHAMLDYTLGPTLAFMPEAFGFPRSGAATVPARAIGAAQMAYSTMTRYELGLYPMISMKQHLILDAITGGVLAASPWLFGFAQRGRKRSWLPHVLFAAAETAIVIFSRTQSKRTVAERNNW